MTRIPLRIPPMTGWSAGINAVGMLAVGWVLLRVGPQTAPWVVWLLVAGVAAWAMRTALAARNGATAGAAPGGLDPALASTGAAHRSGEAWAAAALLVTMTAAGSVTAVPTQGLGVAVLVVAVIGVASDPATTPGAWIAVAIAGALGISAGALLTAAGRAGSVTGSVLGLLTLFAALALAVVLGLGRRAQRVLLAERERANAEAVRAQAAAHRVAIARDLHDVLAHSLGGLVVQLDAAEALLEAGDAERAGARVAAARRLAVAGLDEAREAVRTLRGPDPDDGMPAASAVQPDDLAARLEALRTAEPHEGVHIEESGAPRAVSAALAEALVRAVQEGLSNARKHAPGSAVRVALVWHPDRVECVIQNAMPAEGGREAGRGLAATGGGFGLRGVRERFAAVGGTVTAGTTGTGAAGRFVLRAEAPA